MYTARIAVLFTLLLGSAACTHGARLSTPSHWQSAPTALPHDTGVGDLIVVDGGEVVVGADLLDLPEGFEQRLVIPQANVGDRLRVGDDVARLELGVTGELAFFDLV